MSYTGYIWLGPILGLAFGVTAGCSDSPTAPSPADGSAIVDCAVFAPPATSPYVLPYAVGAGFEVSRTFGHYTTGNDGVGLYAIDLPMPIGTPIHAARGGVVVAVEERFSNEDRATYRENWVMIRHADGTVGRYIHITQNGALVEIGEAVSQGQLVALSGNSGPTTGPHLHFDVQTCGPNLPPGFNTQPCGMTVPVSFRNTQARVRPSRHVSRTRLCRSPPIRGRPRVHGAREAARHAVGLR